MATERVTTEARDEHRQKAVELAVELCDAQSDARWKFDWMETLIQQARRHLSDNPSAGFDRQVARNLLDIAQHLALEFSNDAKSGSDEAHKTLDALKAEVVA